ncbi:phosphate/phosphite/phosphonate ABC transporter substrate-binding protein, partial [bacterium]
MISVPGIRLFTTTAVFTLVVATGILCTVPRAAAEDFKLSIGYIGNTYPNTSSKDIQAAVSVLIKKVAWEYFGRSEARYYDSADKMAADIKNGTIQVACLSSEEYLKLRSQARIEPILMTVGDHGRESELLLLVRRDSGIRSLGDLRNGSIVMPQRNTAESVFRVWLDTMLLREGKPESGAFFSAVKVAPTTAKVIMPVFFRQADACVVTRQAFELTAEMNPQISREMMPIARIENLFHGIISGDVKVSREIKERLRQAFLSLNKSPEGRQLMMLFHVSTFA